MKRKMITVFAAALFAAGVFPCAAQREIFAVDLGAVAPTEAYQGIFMKDDVYLSVLLYTSAAPGEGIGTVESVTRPEELAGGGVSCDTLETVGDIYQAGQGYTIRTESGDVPLTYSDGAVSVGGDSSYAGDYIQISNSGANMNNADVWLKFPEDDAKGEDGNPTGISAYDEIIQKYISGIRAGWDMSGFSDNGLNYLTAYAPDLTKTGYYLKDVDEDGVEELLIGLNDGEAYMGMFYDLYTLKDDTAVRVVQSGERDRYYLCTDNTIANEGSGGAEISSSSYYRMEGTELVLKESVLYDGTYDPVNPWFYSTTDTAGDHSTPVSESEANAVRDRYEYAQVEFTPFSSVGESAESSGAEAGDYLFPNSSTELLTEDQLKGLSAEQLKLARNEIFARHGRRFTTDSIRQYFESKSWYNPQYSSEEFDARMDEILNATEKKNVELIQSLERSVGAAG